MSLSNGIITAPVESEKNTGDIQQCLGVYSDDLEELCKSSAVNKWALYKPVPYSGDTVEQFDFDQNAWKSTATWFEGDGDTKQRWGMRYPMFDGNGNVYGSTGTISTRIRDGVTYREPTAGFFYDLMRGNLRWTRIAPSGSNSSAYRQEDFAGYNHNTPDPLPYTTTRTMFVSGAVETRGIYNLDCGIKQPSQVVVGGLNLPIMTPPSGYLHTFLNLAQCYVGVLWYNTSKDDCFWQCSEVKLQALYNLDVVERAKALRVSIVDADFTKQYNKTIKDWNTRAFLCTKQLGYCEQLTSGQAHYMIACDDPETICTLAIAGVMTIDTYTASKSGTTVTIVLHIINHTGYDKTLVSPKVELITTGTQIVQDSYTWSNQAIANAQTVVLNHKFSRILDNSLNARFTCTYSGGSFDTTIPVVIK